jgi:hypothetical protein
MKKAELMKKFFIRNHSSSRKSDKEGRADEEAHFYHFYHFPPGHLLVCV